MNHVGKSIERITVDGCSPTAPTEEYLAMLRQGGVNCWHMSGTGDLRSLAQWHEFLAQHTEEVALARSERQIREIAAGGKIAVTFGWQWADPLIDPRFNDWASRPPRTSLRAYYVLGLRVVNLTYNVANQFAGGCLDPVVGLTRAGQWLVATMQELGILVDCGGHTGERASLDIIEMAQRPVVCTHSNVLALNDNPRNTSDRVIEGIARTGGVFGVSAINAFMRWNRDSIPNGRASVERANVGRFVDELDYLKHLVGVDHVGFGFDFTHGAPPVNIDPEQSSLLTPEMTYPMVDTIEYVEGLEDITCIGAIEAALRERGWHEDEIRKCYGDNWMRVYRAAWGG
jgi:membrane dipeptidase